MNSKHSNINKSKKCKNRINYLQHKLAKLNKWKWDNPQKNAQFALRNSRKVRLLWNYHVIIFSIENVFVLGSTKKADAPIVDLI